MFTPLRATTNSQVKEPFNLNVHKHYLNLLLSWKFYIMKYRVLFEKEHWTLRSDDGALKYGL